jgi:hypothetical protein
MQATDRSEYQDHNNDILVKCYLTDACLFPCRQPSTFGLFIFRVNLDSLSMLSDDISRNQALLFTFENQNIITLLTTDEIRNVIPISTTNNGTGWYSRNDILRGNDYHQTTKMNYFNSNSHIPDDQYVRFNLHDGTVYSYTRSEISEHRLPKAFIINLYQYALYNRMVKEYLQSIEQSFHSNINISLQIPSIPNINEEALSTNQETKTMIQNILKDKTMNLLRSTDVLPMDIQIALGSVMKTFHSATYNENITGNFYQLKIFDTIYEVFVPHDKTADNKIILTTGVNSLIATLKTSISFIFPRTSLF